MFTAPFALRPATVAARLACLLLLVAIALGCVLYVATGYSALCRWYLSLNTDFYNAPLWTRDFFTPATKAAGNRWCLAGIAVCAACSVVVCAWRAPAGSVPTRQPLFATRWQWVLAGLLPVLAFVLWRWGCKELPHAPDEMFSATNVARQHPFQVAAYYMSPNNHILFNLINKLLFYGTADFVATGRAISLVAYAATLVVIYRWLLGVMGQAVPAFLGALITGMMVLLWGLAAQGRGYSLQTLLAWLAISVLWQCMQHRDDRGQAWLGVLCALGYMVVPTFIFFHGAVVGVLVVAQLRQRRLSRGFWMAQALAGCAVFLFYLPMLCFSGVGWLASNKFVAPVQLSLAQYAAQFGMVFWYNLQAAFSGYIAYTRVWHMVMFFVPALLLAFARRHPAAGRIFRVFIALWVALTVLSFALFNTMLPRMLTPQISFFVVVVICTVWFCAGWVAARFSKSWLAPVVYVPLAGVAIWYYYVQFPVSVQRILYGAPVNEVSWAVTNALHDIPAHSGPVGCSEESFYCYHYLRQAGRPAHLPYHGTEQYIILMDEDPLPDVMKGRYDSVSAFQYFVVYRRR